MKIIESNDGASFMQGQIAALEMAVRAIIDGDPALRARLSTAAGALVSSATQGAPPEFVEGWHHTLRSVNGGSLPVIGEVPPQ